MSKRKMFSIILLSVMLCGLCLIASSCSDKNKKYDVSIRVQCREVRDGKKGQQILGEWIFTPDVDDVYIERDYDGKQYMFYFDAFSMPQNNQESDPWSDGAEFHTAFWKEDESKETIREYLYEKGDYVLLVHLLEYSDELQIRHYSFNTRTVRLHIKVK